MRPSHWWWLLLALALTAGMVPVLSGCGGEPRLLSTQDEIAIGRDAAGQLERRYGLVSDPALTGRVERVGSRIVTVVPNRGTYPWRFRVLNTAEVNAMALPGGFVYATRGLLEVGLSEAELAGVMAHEISHVSRRHSARLLEQAMGAELLVGIATRGRGTTLRQASNVAVELVLLKGYRGYENDSDRWGTIYAYRAGFDPAGLLDFLRQLQTREGREPARWTTFLSTHPVTSDRINRLQNLVAEIRAGQVS